MFPLKGLIKLPDIHPATKHGGYNTVSHVRLELETTFSITVIIN